MRRLSGKRRPRADRGLVAMLRRVGWRTAVPIVLCAVAFGILRWGVPSPVQGIWGDAEARLIDASAALGLKVADIRIDGRETIERRTILKALGVRPGDPIVAVDPARIKDRLERLPWVHAAIVERRLPDTLYIRVVERKPLALWQHNGKIELIDRSGAVIPVPRLDRFAKLPMVVGPHAAAHAADLLAMLASEPDLARRVSAAVRVGDRRWNLRLDNAVNVLLPAEGAGSAWVELARLDRRTGLLKRDLETVDLRLPDRLVLRLGPEALKGVQKEAAPPKKARAAAKST